MRYSSILFVLGILVCCSGECATSRWVKLNSSPVCFSGKNSHPGTFVSERSGFAGALKLVHRSGSIRCGGGGGQYNSHFGCHHFPGLEKHPLNVVVTNGQNKIKFPVSEVNILQPNQAYWYGLDGVNSRSNEIVLQHSFANPYFIYKNQMLRVWYGEDLMNKWESDNVGRVCVDVFAYFV